MTAAVPDDARQRASEGRAGQFKVTQRREVEAARRRAALATQQSQSRAGKVEDVRRIAMEALLGGDNQNDVEEEVEVEADPDDDGDDMAVVDGGEDADMTGGRKPNSTYAMRRLRKLHRTLFFARQFQMPDWMLEPPDDLLDNWFVQVRPEGERCLLLSDGGQVEVRRKNGYVHERFSDSRLPRGLTILDVVCIEGSGGAESSAATAEPGGAADASVEMDAVGEPELQEEDIGDMGADDMDCGHGGRGSGRGGYGGQGRGGGGRGKGGGKGGKGKGRRGRPQGDRKYAVCDALVWGDTDLAGADTEFRMFWLASRFAELPEKHSRRARALQLVPTVPVTQESLLHAYKEDVGYVKDSLLFVHREGHYSIDDPVTPLALIWRDQQVSKYVVDTQEKDGQVVPAEKHLVVLELRGGGRLRTADRTLVAQLDEQGMAQAQELVKGKGTKTVRQLLRCEVGAVDLIGRRLAGVKPVAHVAARTRVWPDSWGRIAFQHMHRQQGPALRALSFEAVLQAAVPGGRAAPQ